MSVNVNVKKIVIAIVLLLITGGSVWWFVSTKEERAVKAEYDLLVKFAQRQAVEIAIIEQRSKLLNYQQQMAVAQQTRRQVVIPEPPIPSPFIPQVTDPVDIE